MRAELRVVEGKQKGTTIPLHVGRFLIGRERDCHLRPSSDLVSRHHCVISIDDFTVRIRDLGSTNGTIVNGERITGQVILKTGDRLQIGKLQFEVVVHEPQSVIAAPTEPPPTFPQKLGDQDSSLSGETVVDFAASQAAPSSSETIVNLHQADTKETTVIPASSGKPKPVLPAVRLPDPSETGAPLAQMPGSQGGKPAGSGDDPRNSAADIIRQFRQMRPR